MKTVSRNMPDSSFYNTGNSNLLFGNSSPVNSFSPEFNNYVNEQQLDNSFSVSSLKYVDNQTVSRNYHQCNGCYNVFKTQELYLHPMSCQSCRSFAPAQRFSEISHSDYLMVLKNPHLIKMKVNNKTRSISSGKYKTSGNNVFSPIHPMSSRKNTFNSNNSSYAQPMIQFYGGNPNSSRAITQHDRGLSNQRSFDNSFDGSIDRGNSSHLANVYTKLNRKTTRLLRPGYSNNKKGSSVAGDDDIRSVNSVYSNKSSKQPSYHLTETPKLLFNSGGNRQISRVKMYQYPDAQSSFQINTGVINTKLNINDEVKYIYTTPNKETRPLQKQKNDIKKKKGIRGRTIIPNFQYDAISARGLSPMIKGKVNQDRHISKYDKKTNTFFFCVCDGHGDFGHLVSQHIIDTIWKQLLDSPSFKSDMSKSLDIIINQLQRYLGSSRCKIDITLSGSTLVCCLIRDSEMYIANVGDSKLVIYGDTDDGLYPVSCTIDHKPSLPQERSRIEKSGGEVHPFYDNHGELIARVCLKNSDSVALGMSRSIGDSLVHSIGVICTPEINRYQLSAKDKYIILASDGLWEFVDPDSIVSIIGDDSISLKEKLKKLVDISTNKWLSLEGYVDDITAIIVKL